MWVIILLKKTAFFLALLFLVPYNIYGADVSARSAIVMDAQTGIILYEKNAYEELPMASTTKIMTALLAIESGRLDETVSITDEMLRTEGSCMGLRYGDKMTLKELVTGMMLTSGNDSANAVAYFISGGIEEFVLLMNKRAKQLGMNDTCFVTPSGLDEETIIQLLTIWLCLPLMQSKTACSAKLCPRKAPGLLSAAKR